MSLVIPSYTSMFFYLLIIDKEFKVVEKHVVGFLVDVSFDAHFPGVEASGPQPLAQLAHDDVDSVVLGYLEVRVEFGAVLFISVYSKKTTKK